MNNEISSVNNFSFFGKLPQFPDFISHRAGSQEFRILDDWLQKGIAQAKMQLGSEWKPSYQNSGYFDFFFPIANTKRIITGVINSSNDKSGRDFPFIVFSLMPAQLFYSNSYGTLPLILNSFFYRAKQLFNYSIDSNDVGKIISYFDKSEIRLNSFSAANKIFDEYLITTTASEFINRINIDLSDEFVRTPEDKNYLAFRFTTDDENYNFDTGFLISLFSVLFKTSNAIPCFFKTITPSHTVKLYVYFTQPETSEYSKIITGNTDNYSLNALTEYNNKDISLKDLLDKKLL